MALDTYANLQTAIAAWLMRDDLTDNIPDFITLCENRCNRRIRVREMETTVVLTPALDSTTGDAVCDLPEDYIEARRVVVNTSPVSILTPISLDMAADNFSTPGYPFHYTVSGASLLIFPANETTVSLTYYAAIPPLALDNTSNWLLAKAPEIYLYGSLLESAPFMEDDNRLATWISLYKAAVDELLQADTRGSWSKAVARIKGCTP